MSEKLAKELGDFLVDTDDLLNRVNQITKKARGTKAYKKCLKLQQQLVNTVENYESVLTSIETGEDDEMAAELKPTKIKAAAEVKESEQYAKLSVWIEELFGISDKLADKLLTELESLQFMVDVHEKIGLAMLIDIFSASKQPNSAYMVDGSSLWVCKDLHTMTSFCKQFAKENNLKEPPV